MNRAVFHLAATTLALALNAFAGVAPPIHVEGRHLVDNKGYCVRKRFFLPNKKAGIILSISQMRKLTLGEAK